MQSQNSKDQNTVFDFPILVGDIGGTNVRFALVLDAYAEPKSFPIVQTKDFATLDDAIQTVVLDNTSILPRTAVLAVAGPVDGDEIDLTNCDWVVRPKVMLEKLGLDEVVVLNDFEAQALAVVALDKEHLVQIGGSEADTHGSKVVLGPGTGLGVAGLVHAKHMWVPVPGEGGHIDVGPRSDREREIFPHIKTIGGRISAEQMLCGNGLVNLYNAVAKASEVKPEFTHPSEISTAGLAGTDKIAEETIDLFAVLLGRVAGDLALIFMARGGIYLAGGISQKVLPALQKPAFRAAFDDKAPHSAMMTSMPIFVITHPTAALTGLAAYSRTPNLFGVTLDDRRWSKLGLKSA